MPTLRYKNHPDYVFEASNFNPVGLAEVLTGDDSASIKELDVCIKGIWVDMGLAFKNRDLITDNYNLHFFEPRTAEDKERGFTL